MALWGHEWEKHELYILLGETENNKAFFFKYPVLNGNMCERRKYNKELRSGLSENGVASLEGMIMDGLTKQAETD